MHRVKFATLALTVILLAAVSAVAPTNAQMGVWRDINPTAYIQPPANPDLNSVYMLSANEGWAVSDYYPTTNTTTGLPGIFHYDGSTWNLVPAPRFPDFPSLPSPYNLTSVNFGPPNNPISRNDGWAVGFNGTTMGTACGTTGGTCSVALHWDGIAWRVQNAGLTGANAGPLWSVFMVSSTDVWAVGENSAGTAGTFWHWTGTAGLGGGWNLFSSPVAGIPFYSVFMVSATEGWAVGAGGAIYHYFGGSWTSFPSPVSVSLRSVFMLSATEGWAVGDGGTIVHYSAGTWTGPVSPGITPNNLISVFMVSSTEGWSVGMSGTILHYSGGVWTALPISLIPTSPFSLFDFHAVYYNTASDGWAVGNFGVILHFDGTNWGTVTSPTLNNFTSVHFGPPLTSVNPSDGWAVGNASTLAPFEPTIYHWNGFMWTKGVAIGTTNDLNSVYMVNTGDVWTVGGGPRPTSTCTATPVALCPTILHYTGGSWNTITPPPGNYRLKSVFMVSSNEGWAVGQQAGNLAIILHYTVTGGVGSWATFPSPAINGYGVTTPSLNSVFMVSPNEGWTVGDNATILHYTVTGGIGTWNTVVVSGVPGISRLVNLTSVFMLSPTSGWAVGGVALNPDGPPPNPGSFSTGPVIIYWDGTKWSPVPAPQIPGGVSPDGLVGQPASQRIPNGILKSVYCTGPNDCWTTGFPGKLLANIMHWDGFGWNSVTLSPPLLGQDASLKGIPPILTSIYMTSPSNGWIVGSSFGINTGVATKPLSTILRFSPFGGVFYTTSTQVSTITVSTSTVAVTSSASTTVITIPTTPTAVAFCIKVVDSNGNPVQGATVTVTPPGQQISTSSLGLACYNLPPGVYSVAITRGGTTTTQTFTVAGGGQTFTATVSGGGGPGIPGFPVESILAGVAAGLAVLSILRRRRRSRSH